MTIGYATPSHRSSGRARMLLTRHLPLLSTALVCALLYAAACYRLEGFGSVQVFLNFFSDNAFLGIAAVGLTFVILSGGIDLSVGSMIAFTSILAARLLASGIHPGIVVLLVLLIGASFGLGIGCLIQFGGLAPFLVTLAAMFLARGGALLVSVESVPIDHPLVSRLADWSLPIGASFVPMTLFAFAIVVLVAAYVAHFTRFGRNVYAIGGNESSAVLMGLPVARTKVLIYTVSGLCSALAGLVFTLYTLSGNPTAGTGLELDAIAAVVIGGTLLSGGVGSVFGTVLGILILGIIQTAIVFDGRLSSWWTKIVIGGLLLVFILLQKLFTRSSSNSHG